MNQLTAIAAIAVVAVAWPGPAVASQEQFELGVQLASAISSQFDRTGDIGIGGRFSWHPVEPVGIEAEIDLYPGDFPDRLPFSRGRMEGLFGATVGPSFDRMKVFATLRPGFMIFRAAPEPLVCILIFPPPLSCVLASGRTVFALDVGGGIEVFATRKTFVRVDVGDRLLKYPGPAFDNNRRARRDGFVSHDFRLATGGGLRF